MSLSGFLNTNTACFLLHSHFSNWLLWMHSDYLSCHKVTFLHFRWYRRSDGSFHRSQHPHYSWTVWLSVWGKIDILWNAVSPKILNEIKTYVYCLWLFVLIQYYRFTHNFFHTMLLLTMTCKNVKRSVAHLCVTHTHTHLSSCNCEYINIWVYCILD